MRDFIIKLIICSATMSAVILAYIAITPLLTKRYHVKWRYYAWLIIVFGLIIPFRPQFNNAIVKVDTQGEVSAPIIQIGNASPLTLSFTNTELFQPTAKVPGSINISLWQVAAIAWLAGVIFFLAYHVIKHYRFSKMIKRWSEKITDEQTVALFQKLKEEMKISKRISLYRCSSIGSPMMVGLTKPRILFPECDFDQDELGFILRHELVHYKRKDLLYKSLVLLATIIHWFNPIVYLMAKAIDMQCELSCDDAVVRHTSQFERQQYSETIIGVVKFKSKMTTALSTNYCGGVKGMKKRILSILDTAPKKTGAVILCIAILLIAISSSLVVITKIISDDLEKTQINGRFAEEVIQKTEFPTETQAGQLYVNDKLAFSIEFPAEWEGLYEITEDYVERSMHGGAGITVYQKATHDLDPSRGELFYLERWIGTYTTEAPPIMSGYCGVVLEVGKYTYMLRTASDVRYIENDKNITEEYNRLFNQLDVIMSNVKFIEDTYFSYYAGDSDKKIFLDSEEGKQLRESVYRASIAWLQADAGELGKYMVNPDEALRTIRGMTNVYDDLVWLCFKGADNERTDGKIIVWYEFLLQGEDSYSYVTTEMHKVDGVWMVGFIGGEK